MARTKAWHDRWREARIAAGYSSAEKLAKEVGVHRLTATAWETGRRRPQKKSHVALADLGPELASLILELEEERGPPADLEQLIRRTVIDVLHEVQFPRLEALEAQLVKTVTILERLADRVDELADGQDRAGASGGGSPE